MCKDVNGVVDLSANGVETLIYKFCEEFLCFGVTFVQGKCVAQVENVFEPRQLWYSRREHQCKELEEQVCASPQNVVGVAAKFDIALKASAVRAAKHVSHLWC